MNNRLTDVQKKLLRDDAIRAGGGKWRYVRSTLHSQAYITDEKGSTVINCTAGDVPANCASFLESAHPAVVLLLLDELAEKDAEVQEYRKAKPVYFVEIEGDQDINAGRIQGKERPDLGLLPDGINYLYASPQPLTDAERAELQGYRKAASLDLKTANLINKFYERYPLADFKSDSERAEALGYFMAGAELQCYGEFIAYEGGNGDE